MLPLRWWCECSHRLGHPLAQQIVEEAILKARQLEHYHILERCRRGSRQLSKPLARSRRFNGPGRRLGCQLTPLGGVVERRLLLRLREVVGWLVRLRRVPGRRLLLRRVVEQRGGVGGCVCGWRW